MAQNPFYVYALKDPRNKLKEGRLKRTNNRKHIAAGE